MKRNKDVAPSDLQRIDRRLYKRGYQMATGDWQTLYYGIFVCWDGKRRKFPLGAHLATAKEQLKALEGDDFRRVDFEMDKFKGEEPVCITLAKWSKKYLDLVRNKRSLDKDKSSCERLNNRLGALPLSEITRTKIMEYKNLRLEDPIIRRGKPVAGRKMKVSSVNRELACLRHMLKLAEDDGLIEHAPRIKLDSERKFARRRVVSDEEFQALLDNSKRYAQRVFIALCETAMRKSEVLNLTWDRVDLKSQVVRLRPEDTKEDDKRIVPITPVLQTVLDELRDEQRKLPNILNRVFTRDKGQSIRDIRTAFENARKRAGLEDVVIHDLKHTAITRWATAGVPQEAAMLASGHKSLAMHYRYANLQESHLREAFKMFTRCSQEESVDEAQPISY